MSKIKKKKKKKDTTISREKIKHKRNRCNQDIKKEYAKLVSLHPAQH
jgi:hypothetical protein